jgi:uncharacterized Zn-binding protein involved in type VI secretion
MATIKKTIQNLKPGKQYLLTVKPKDADLNVTLDPSTAIRFSIPQDLTQPAELGDLTIVGNYKSIMISFNPSNESDLRGYNYEVYLPEDIAQDGSTYVIISGSTPYLSGFSASNVITADVPQNSETTNNVDANTGVTTTVTTEKLYFARVQSIDTSGNTSAWTPIVASTATTFIESAHIIDLTASKITAGTIGAHTITLAGAQSIIKSSTFDGVSVGNGSYANATTGWLINGQGKSYFYDATIVGSIDIGGFDSGSFHVNTDGDLWSGAGTLAAAPFKVLKEGDVTANTITTKNLTLTGNTVMSSNSKIYLGTGEYANTNTPFYVDDTSKFSLGNKLTWDGSSLTVSGNINITGGNTLTLINNAESNASTAYNTAISAQGLAITANTNAGNAYSAALTAQGLALTANTNAANAQNTADDAYSTANTKITAGGAAFDINGNATTIDGDKISTGSITATQISSSYVYAGSIDAGQISGGTISASISITSFGTLQAGLSPWDEGYCIFGQSANPSRVNGIGFVNPSVSGWTNNFYPYSDGGGNLGTNGGFRWNNLYYLGSLLDQSDIRTKNTIEPIVSGLALINKLNPVTYYKNISYGAGKVKTEESETGTYKLEDPTPGKRKHFGLIAQEVKQAMDEVGFDTNEYSGWTIQDPSDPESEQGLMYMEFIGILIRAVQELSAKVEQLESRLDS